MVAAKARAELISYFPGTTGRGCVDFRKTKTDMIQKSGWLPDMTGGMSDNKSSSSNPSRPIVVLYFPDSAALARRDSD